MSPGKDASHQWASLCQDAGKLNISEEHFKDIPLELLNSPEAVDTMTDLRIWHKDAGPVADKMLQGLVNLESIGLHDCGLTSTMVMSLCDILPTFTRLRRLRLDNNKDVSCNAWVELLKALRSVTT